MASNSTGWPSIRTILPRCRSPWQRRIRPARRRASSKGRTRASAARVAAVSDATSVCRKQIGQGAQLGVVLLDDLGGPSPASLALAKVPVNSVDSEPFQAVLAACRAALARPGHVIVLTGAGVSAESGIPTFRGKDGYWTVGAREYHPQELATHDAFARDAVGRVGLVPVPPRRVPARPSRTPAHAALVRARRRARATGSRWSPRTSTACTAAPAAPTRARSRSTATST